MLSKHGSSSKYVHYLFTVSVLIMSLSILALLNAYFHFIDVLSYDVRQDASSSFLLAGYLGMFLGVAILPIPDYLLVPAYGYLSSIGLYNPLTTFLVCLVSAIFPLEYICGRFAARPLLLKSLSFLHISEKDLEVAEKWLVEHGKFSVFTSTFITYGYTVVSLAAGMLKMSIVTFLAVSTLGFGLRFIFLEYVGYYSVYVFTSSFDYSQRALFSLLLILSSAYTVLYLAGTYRSISRKVSAL